MVHSTQHAAAAQQRRQRQRHSSSENVAALRACSGQARTANDDDVGVQNAHNRDDLRAPSLCARMRTVCGFAGLHNRRRVHHKKWCESSTAMGPRVATNGLRSRTPTYVYLQGGRSQVRGRRGMAWGTWEPPVACRAGPWSKRSRQRHPPPHGPGSSAVVDVGLQGVNTARSVGWIDQPATYKHVRGLHRAKNITGRSPRHPSLPNAQIWCSGPPIYAKRLNVGGTGSGRALVQGDGPAGCPSNSGACWKVSLRVSV